MIYDDQNSDTEMSGGSMDDLLSQIEGKANSYEDDEVLGQEMLKPARHGEGRSGTKELEAVYDVPVQISAVLGRSTMPVHQLLKLGRGAVVELDRRVGEAIDIYVNNRLVARGEVVVVDDHLGVTMTEILKSDRS